MFHSLDLLETIVLLYHQKEDFISVKYEPKDADDLKKSFDRDAEQGTEVPGKGK